MPAIGANLKALLQQATRDVSAQVPTCPSYADNLSHMNKLQHLPVSLPANRADRKEP
jgi:hypothetical protein